MEHRNICIVSRITEFSNTLINHYTRINKSENVHNVFLSFLVFILKYTRNYDVQSFETTYRLQDTFSEILTTTELLKTDLE